MSSSVASVLFILYTTLSERRFEVGARKVIPSERRIAAIGEHCCKAARSGIVCKRRLADAVEGIASVAAKVVVEALDRVRSCDADDGFVGEGAEVIVEECRNSCGIVGFDLPPCAAVGERYRRRAVGVDGIRERTIGIVAVGRNDSTRPGASRELAVGGVVVARPLPVGVDLVGDKPRRLVAEPARCIASGWDKARPSRVAVCRHGNLVAELVVSVVDGIRCATLGNDASFSVVCRRDGVRERVGDGCLPTEGVVAVGRRIAKRVDGRSDAAKVVVSRPRRVAASVRLRNLALERIIGECRRDASLRGRGHDHFSSFF